MSEKQPGFESKKVLSPEEQQHHLEQAEALLPKYSVPEGEDLTAEQCAEKIREFETLCENFELKHDLGALNALQLYTSAEARECAIRVAAKEDMIHIISLMHHLERQSQIPRDTLQKFYAQYEIFDAAIGSLTGDGVDHSIRKIRGRV